MSETETKEWRGSVCKGGVTSRWPFGKLIASSDRIEIRSLLGQSNLPKESISSIECSRFFPWLWMGIRIRNTVDRDLRFCPFLFWKRQQVLDHLKSLGYQVPLQTVAEYLHVPRKTLNLAVGSLQYERTRP